MKTKLSDRIGQRFGKWTVIGVCPLLPGDLQKQLLCRCKCGMERPVQGSNLYSGKSTQCYRCGVAQVGKARSARAASTYRKRGRRYRPRAQGRTARIDCPDCGGWCAVQSPRCKACDNRQRMGKPTKYPISITTIAKKAGLSRQRIHQLIQAESFGAVAKRFGFATGAKS